MRPELTPLLVPAANARRGGVRPEKLMRMLVALASTLMLLAAPASGRAAAADEGRWTLREAGGAGLQLELQWHDRSTWERVIPESALSGLPGRDALSGTAGPVVFRMERDAGQFEFIGSFRGGRGEGQFRFHPNGAFLAALRELGIQGVARATGPDLGNLVLGGFSAEMIREFRALGVPVRTMDEVVDLAIPVISPGYVRTLQALGVRDAVTVEAVIEARMSGVSAEFLRELARVGVRGLSVRELAGLRFEGVTTDFVRALRESGHTRVSPAELVRFRRAARGRP